MAVWWQGRFFGMVSYGLTARGRALRFVRLLAADGVRRASLEGRRTRWDILRAGVARRGGRPSVAQGLQALSFLGGRAPGLERWPRERLNVETSSGTPALRWLVATYHRFRPAQRRAAEVLLRRLSFAPARTASDVVTLERAADRAGSRDGFYYQGVVNALLPKLRSHLPLGLTVLAQKWPGPPPPEHAGAAAVTSVVGPGGAHDAEPAIRCEITVYPQVDGRDAAAVESILAHEIGHCYQGQSVGVKAFGTGRGPAWVSEGLPSWMAASALRRVSRGGVFDRWDRWGLPLTTLDYEGAGFFGMVSDEIGEAALWQRVPDVFRASDSRLAVLAAAGSSFSEVADHWGPSHAGRPDLGTRWLRRLPVPMDTAGSSTFVGPATSAIVGQQGVTLTPGRYASLLYSIEPTTDMFRIDGVGAPLGLLQDSTNLSFRAASRPSEYFCAASKCECPAGQTGTIPDATHVTLPFYAGLAGGIGERAGLRLTAAPYSEFCGKNKPPPPGGDVGGISTVSALADKELDGTCGGLRNVLIHWRDGTVGAADSAGLESVGSVDIGGSEVPVLKARVAGHHVYQRAGIYDVQVEFVVTCLTASEEPYDFQATGVPLATVRVGG